MGWRGLAVGAMLATAVPAHATEGLAWQWDGKSVQYLARAEVKLPEILWALAEQNTEARLAVVRLDVVATCTPEDTTKKGWMVVCNIDDVQLAAAPILSDIGRALPILDEYDERLLGSTVHLNMNADGRIKSVGLGGWEPTNRRLVDQQETLRLLMARAFAPLDLQLPKKGDDKGKPWRQTTPLAFQFPGRQGTMGSAVVDHAVSGGSGDVVEVVSRGGGMLGSGEMVAVGDKEQPKHLYEMTMASSATFDTATGVMVQREYLAEGYVKSSTAAVDDIGGIDYIQAASIVRVEGEAPVLGPNSEINPNIGTEDAG